MPTPAGAAVLQVLVGAIAGGLGDHDWGDLVAAAERQGDVELQWNRLTRTRLRQLTAYIRGRVTQPRVRSVGAEDVGGDAEGGDGGGDAGVHRDLHDRLDELLAA